MKPVIKILLLTTLVVLPLLAPPSAHAARKMQVAIQDEGVFLFDPATTGYGIDREAALFAARRMGVTHIRMNVLWYRSLIESQREQTTVPSNIQYDWQMWDEAIARAKAYGIKVQLTLTGDPPSFACGNKEKPFECDGFKPNIRQWKAFVKEVARHFKGRVTRYSIWNEPNWYTWLSPHKKSPLLYRKLAQTGYKAIKRVNKKAEVVLGEFAPHFQKNISMPPLQFIREMVCVNKKLERTRRANKKCGKKPLKFDAFATHPYDFEHKPKFKRDNKDEVTMSNLDAFRKLLDKLRKKGLLKPGKKKKFPIYLTEHGYMVADNPRVPAKRRTPESRRQKWIVQAWKIAQGTKRVKENMHYVFVSPPATSPSGFFDMGLLQSDGVPRGSYFALGNWLQEAAADGKVATPGPCSAC
jgi:hypothetical protein